MRIKYFTALALAGGLYGLVGQINGQAIEKKTLPVFTDEEARAVRVEMIEMDIAVRTLASMISLNKTDRLEVIFRRLGELQMTGSVYHKNGISGAVKKWKTSGLMKHVDTIQSESAAMVEYLNGWNTGEKKQEVNWNEVHNANRKILENCQECHKRSGVELH